MSTDQLYPIDDLELDVLADDLLDDRDAPVPGWHVTDERSAERALRRIRKARRDLAARTAPARELLEAHQARAAELQAWIAEEEERTASTVEHFKALLTSWHRRLLRDDPKAKSIRLSGGRLTSRAGRERVEIDDTRLDAIVAAAEADDADFAVRVPKVDRRRLLGYIKATGVLPPGVTLHQPTDDDRTFDVEVPDVG